MRETSSLVFNEDCDERDKMYAYEKTAMRDGRVNCIADIESEMEMRLKQHANYRIIDSWTVGRGGSIT
jgi:hypothetical protein